MNKAEMETALREGNAVFQFEMVSKLPRQRVKIDRTSPDMLHFTLADGRKLQHPRTDTFNGEISHKWHESHGEYIYEYTIDDRKLGMITIGENSIHWLGKAVNDADFEQFKVEDAKIGISVRRAEYTSPEGWRWMLSGWYPPMEELAPRAENHHFTMTTAWKPGLVPMDLAGTHVLDPFPILPGMGSEEQTEVVEAILETTDVRRFVIGPAIAPSSTEDDLRALVTKWANDYGFSFLQPLTAAGADFRATLDKLKPATDLEKQIVECLRAALQ